MVSSVGNKISFKWCKKICGEINDILSNISFRLLFVDNPGTPVIIVIRKIKYMNSVKNKGMHNLKILMELLAWLFKYLVWYKIVRNIAKGSVTLCSENKIWIKVINEMNVMEDWFNIPFDRREETFVNVKK